MQTFQQTPTANAIQAPSPEMGMANPVDKAVDPSDDQEPKIRTIGNRNRRQTRRIAGLQRPLTILTTILTGLLLTWSAPRAAPQRYGWRRRRALLHSARASGRTAC